MKPEERKNVWIEPGACKTLLRSVGGHFTAQLPKAPIKMDGTYSMANRCPTLEASPRFSLTFFLSTL